MAAFSVIVVQIIFFVGLLWILRNVLGKHASSTTQRLQQLTQEHVTKEAELKRRLEEADRKYQEQLAKAKQEIEKLRAQGLQEVELAKRKIIEEAHQEGERIVNKAIETRDAMRAEIERSFDQRAINKAAELIQSVLPEALCREAQSIWLEELLNQGLPQALEMGNQIIVSQVQVVSAYELTEDQVVMIERRLKELLGQSVEVEHHADRDLIAGIIVNLGAVVLNGSLSAKLEERTRAEGSGS